MEERCDGRVGRQTISFIELSIRDGWVQVEGKTAGLTGEADEGTERPSESNSATVLVLCARI